MIEIILVILMIHIVLMFINQQKSKALENKAKKIKLEVKKNRVQRKKESKAVIEEIKQREKAIDKLEKEKRIELFKIMQKKALNDLKPKISRTKIKRLAVISSYIKGTNKYGFEPMRIEIKPMQEDKSLKE